MRSYSVTAFKAQCLAIVDELSRTGETIVLVRRGKPVARVVGTRLEEEDVPPQHRLRGTVEVLGDLVEPVVPIESWEALRPARPRKRGR